MPKRKIDDDFVGTIYDDELDVVGDEDETERGGLSEDEVIAAEQTGSNKKRKRQATQAGQKKRQKGGDADAGSAVPALETADGEIESDFDFQIEDGLGDLDEDDEWTGANGDVQGLRGIDEIVAARMGKTGAAKGEAEEDEEVELSDEEMLADDVFGMQAGSEDEEEGVGTNAEGPEADGDTQANDEEDDEDEDDDFAAPRAHPDDMVPAAESSGEESDDEEEKQRQKDFFAPESDLTTPNAIETSSGSFMDYQLSRPILKGLSASGFTNPTPIQARTIPMALLGKDIVGSAVTGSGKTGAFMIPILERLFFRSRDHATTRVAILLPTRELALQAHQVAVKLASYTDITFGQAIGGLNQKVQENALKQRPDIVIATPGRFIDFMRNSSALQTDSIEILVLDEADRMLEDGFAAELNEILTSLPKSRQTMLFSATMTSNVDDLIRVGCSRPVRLAVDASRRTVTGLTQEFIRLRPGREHFRLPYLLYLCTTTFRSRTIVFFRQKALAHRIRVLFALCGLSAAELHGAMTQEQRIASVEAFRAGKAAFLLATDLASRGLDIRNVDAVINYDAPQSHEIYLHRVGRTARAGRTGRACTLAAEPDRKVVKQAVKAARQQGATIKSRSIAQGDAEKWEKKIAGLEEEIEAVLKEEKEERVMKTAEMQAKRAENIMVHEKEILARPKKTWFQGQKEKGAAREKGRAALNGVRGSAAAASGGEGETMEEKIAAKMAGMGKKKLSGKEKKRLDLRDERLEGGRTWKKGKAERAGGGALAPAVNKKKGKGKTGGKPGGKPAGKPASKTGGGSGHKKR